MSLNGFYIYILVFVLALMQTFYFFKHHFSGVDVLKHEVAKLEEQVKREQTKSMLAFNEAEAIRQNLATLLPDKIKSRKDGYEVRALASVLQAQAPLPLDSSASLLKKGKEFFTAKKYPEAISVFREIADKYPDSQAIPESLFLLSESFFQIQSTEDCVSTIESMVQLFPESELTGFALLRLSGILFSRKLDDEAIQVLQTVRHSFAYNKELVEQTNVILKKAEQ